MYPHTKNKEILIIRIIYININIAFSEFYHSLVTERDRQTDIQTVGPYVISGLGATFLSKS